MPTILGVNFGVSSFKTLENKVTRPNILRKKKSLKNFAEKCAGDFPKLHQTN